MSDHVVDRALQLRVFRQQIPEMRLLPDDVLAARRHDDVGVAGLAAQEALLAECIDTCAQPTPLLQAAHTTITHLLAEDAGPALDGRHVRLRRVVCVDIRLPRHEQNEVWGLARSDHRA